MVSSHEMQLLSAGQLVHASAHGNLAAPSVITRATPPLATHEAWLTDRWQAARDMSGTPLAGTQWVTLELESGCIAHRAVLDWETARADDYELQLRWHDRTMRADAVKSPWETLNVTRTSRNFSHQHVVDDCTLRRRRGQRSDAEAIANTASTTHEYRLLIHRTATPWGASLWRLYLWGECAQWPPATTRGPPALRDAQGARGLAEKPSPALLASARPEVAQGEARCVALHNTHGVVPGQSWGRLSEAQVAEWKLLRCDQFYCQPSPMEAVGQYHCVPKIK
jgi:hypothetical protein